MPAYLHEFLVFVKTKIEFYMIMFFLGRQKMLCTTISIRSKIWYQVGKNPVGREFNECNIVNR